MTRARGLAVAVATALVVGTGLLAALPASAQQGGGNVNPGRDCQYIRTCNFAKNGAVRGCLSSYSCRTCKLVAAKCEIGGLRKCREFVCSWGG